jgi:NTE family protein
VDVAIRASVAIPGVVTPIMVNGRLLVDGGVLNPVPIEPVMGVGADYTLAVLLSGWTPRDFGGPAR